MAEQSTTGEIRPAPGPFRFLPSFIKRSNLTWCSTRLFTRKNCQKVEFMKFYTQFTPKPLSWEFNDSPSETVPDQSMTIQEIIARFVRTGSMPVSVHTDIGDNEAFEPEFDPLDVQPAEVISSLKPAEEPAKKPVKLEGDNPPESPDSSQQAGS